MKLPAILRIGAFCAATTAAGFLVACSTPQETRATAVARSPAISERFVSAESLNEMALALPRPPDGVDEFDRAVTLLLKSSGADWPRAAERAKETAPKDVYSRDGFDYLVLVDATLDEAVRHARTPEDRAAACRARCPATCALLERATADLVKSKYKPYPRPRPTGERTDSYPSGHAAQAAMQCRLLWEILRTSSHPGAEDTLIREMYARAFDRVMIAVHHPTDVAAGVAFGLAVAQKMIDSNSPAFGDALGAARREW